MHGVFTILALAPWAYAGFEFVSHSTAEFKFPVKKTFTILVVSLVASAAAYALLALMAVTYAPAGMNAHLSKPIEPDKLYAKFAELIN